MSISIFKITSAIDAGRGPTLASQFKVDIHVPTALLSNVEAFSARSLSILCQSVSLPGRQIATSELGVYGSPVKMPYGYVYQDLYISFLCTNSMAERKVIEEWNRIIIDPTTNYVNYYDTYVGNILVHKIDQSGATNHSIIYEEAYPTAIFEQELAAWNNDWLRLVVQFSYRRWRSRFDVYAANKAGLASGELNPAEPAGVNGIERPDDIFASTGVISVPKSS